MAIKPFKTLNTDSQDLNRVQDNIEEALSGFINNPIIYGNLLTNVKLVSGSNVVNHGLGRVLQGWSTTRIRSLATIYDTQDSNKTPAKNLLLTSSADVTVDLYCF